MPPYSSSVPRRARPKLWRAVGMVVLVFFAAVLIGLAFFYSMARAALPQLDGSLAAGGLKQRVVVTRDGHGVPTIDAGTLDDLLFAQGYVTAQDRLWQMDVMRRFAAGELAEILGSGLVKHDREQRVLQIRQAARKALEVASGDERARFEAYTRGVNASIEEQRPHLPLEFRILRYSPKPWTAEDSMLAAAQMVKDLNHGMFEDTLAREKILAKLGPDLTGDLYVNKSWRDRPPTEVRSKVEVKPDDEGDSDLPDEEDNSVVKAHLPAVPGAGSDSSELPDDLRRIEGSNDWVVSGAHTVTGKPLLSNDMHLGHQMPNLWYEAHLRGAGLDVAGVTLPGLPYVIVGHNQRIAWGFTNVGPTVEDIYVESFNPQGQYQTPGGWKDAERRHEVIHVKNSADVEFDVLVTRHGPVVSELVPGEKRKLALRWTLYDGVHNPFFEVNSAQNWDQFRRGFAKFDAPGQNVVFADVDGNIGYQATGKIPMRSSGDGSLLEDGSNDAHEWVGFIPFEKMPSIYNPPSGILATANGRITPDKYPYSISTEWEAPWRTQRIYRVLDSGKKFAAADMLSLQMDIYSECDRFFAERFVYSLDHAGKVSARAHQAADILRSWNGRMSADSAAASIASRSRLQLEKLLLKEKLGDDAGADAASGNLSWKSYSWQQETAWLENVVQHQPKRWLPQAFQNYDELLAAAVEQAVNGNGSPADLTAWRWGRSHPVEIEHPILSKVPFLASWSGPGLQEQAGSGFTVKAVSRNHGPSERFTADLSNWDSSTLNVVTGQGGNLFSPYYMDQWKAWYEGFTFRLPFSKEAVQSAKAHSLVLEPKP